MPVERSRSREARDDGVELAHDDALGHLELELLGAHRVPGEGGEHLIGEVLEQELGGGDVDAHAQRLERRAVPAGELSDGLLEHPCADRVDQPRLLGDRDELPRGDRAARRVVPADQGLDPDDAPVPTGHLRLEQEHELVPPDRVAELELELRAAEGVAAERAIEAEHAALALTLGLVHREVGPWRRSSSAVSESSG